jgi:hypothetical protein
MPVDSIRVALGSDVGAGSGGCADGGPRITPHRAGIQRISHDRTGCPKGPHFSRKCSMIMLARSRLTSTKS